MSRRSRSTWLPPGWPPAARSGGRVIIAANGDPEPSWLMQALVQPGDLVLAADGGLCQLMEAGLSCDLLVGDLDSCRQLDLRALEEQGRVRAIWQHPADKDESDLELALRCACAANPREIAIVGALGGRLDHQLTNLSLLHRQLASEPPIWLWGQQHRATLLAGPCARTVQTRPGETFSLIPQSSRASGIALTGARYSLQGANLYQGGSRGLSNVAEASEISLRLERGRLLLVLEGWTRELQGHGRGPDGREETFRPCAG